MSAAMWRDSVVDYIRQAAQPVDKFGHQPRLYALSRQLGEGQGCDDDVLFAAAWMHDLGVFVGHRPADPAELVGWNHIPYTMAKSAELLRGWGFPEEKLAAVAEAIRTHQPGDEPATAEAVVLRDADILEQLGAVGAFRALVKVGRDTRYARFSEVVPVLERALADLPGKLRLPLSREFAQSRVKILRELLEALRVEAGALLH